MRRGRGKYIPWEINSVRSLWSPFITFTTLVTAYGFLFGTTGYCCSDHPTINGSPEHPPCPHCLCGPCIVQQPPDFLTGMVVPCAGNNRKRYQLYRLLGGLLDHLGFWQHPTYTCFGNTHHDICKAMPHCIQNVSALTPALKMSAYHFTFSTPGDN